jgi:hypothetical protein
MQCGVAVQCRICHMQKSFACWFHKTNAMDRQDRMKYLARITCKVIRTKHTLQDSRTNGVRVESYKDPSPKGENREYSAIM